MALTLTRTYSNSIRLTWPSTYTWVKIVRRLRDFPVNENDGTLVYEGSGTLGTYEDITGLEDKQVYYYTLYYKQSGIYDTTSKSCSYREAAAGEDEDNLVPHGEPFDTTVYENENCCVKQANDMDFKLAGDGIYAILYNLNIEALNHNEGEVVDHESFLTVNGSNVPGSHASGHIYSYAGRGTYYGTLNGHAMIEGNQNDLVRLFNQNVTAVTTNNCARRPNMCDINFIRMDPTGSYCWLSGANSPAQFVTWGVQDKIDTNVFGHSTTVDPHIITLKEVGWYWVMYTVHYHSSGSYMKPVTFFRYTGSPIYFPGSVVGGMNANPASPMTLSASFLIYNSIPNTDVALAKNWNITTGFFITDETRLWIAKLPAGTEAMSITGDTTQSLLGASGQYIDWNTNVSVDSGSFTHSQITNNDLVTLAKDGDYLFMQGIGTYSPSGVGSSYIEQIVRSGSFPYSGIGGALIGGGQYGGFYGGSIHSGMSSGTNYKLGITEEGLPATGMDAYPLYYGWSAVNLSTMAWSLDTTTTGTDDDHQKWVVHVETGSSAFFERMKTLFPSMYFLNDSVEDVSTSFPTLVKTFMALTGEEIEKLAEFFEQILDVNNTPGEFLAGIAQLIGLNANIELSYTRQREEIKAHAERLKYKGTATALLPYIKAITQLDATIENWNDNLIVLNDTDLTGLVDFDDDDALFMIGQQGDEAVYLLDFSQSENPNSTENYDADARYNTVNFGLYIEMDQNVSYTSLVHAAVRRMADWWSPLFAYATIVLWDLYTEDFNQYLDDEGGG